ncbi:hypothetical protein ILYODFUR_037226 [Ilyodon furcidens]|uniref:Uncharacterized protein n=1 Tax=Ilyodon furcidens TaxID=33524 RepID=A0ABV0VKQ1_9TELE
MSVNLSIKHSDMTVKASTFLCELADIHRPQSAGSNDKLQSRLRRSFAQCLACKTSSNLASSKQRTFFHMSAVFPKWVVANFKQDFYLAFFQKWLSSCNFTKKSKSVECSTHCFPFK